MKLILLLISFFCLTTLSSTSMAAGPGEGDLVKYNVPIGQCSADSITVKWNLDSFFGEPTVAGSFKWTGNSQCTLPTTTTLWLEVKNSQGGIGYVYLSPLVPEANEGYGYNTTGSPNWNSTLCSFAGTEKTGCLDEASAKDIWRSGYVSDFIVTWDGSETTQIDDAPDGDSPLSNKEKVDIIFDLLELSYPQFLYPTARTDPYQSGDLFYYRFYGSSVQSVAIELAAVELSESEIWYYYIDEWYYFATVEEANELLCDGGCFESDDIPASVDTRTEDVVTWKITDNCNDGYYIDYKFWDRTNSARAYWGPYKTTQFGQTETNNLSCIVGEKICFGGQTGNKTWGVGFDQGDGACEDCCAICEVGGGTYYYNPSCS